ncbi:DNA repair protein RAD51 homolog 3 isoform X2 [Dendrobium catenatum]|uniref:DNA repair protein RAD51 homolog 3 n=1 Tax=Dendrobium catenatum TaxID=906689 RepID=A0A2I0WYR2_9ASPA|nr:DNA repair protein RAD51 homolog 3 isoform X2 [Dendrobium catenatum]PKU80793.1 DNA repair protein RAD51 like 3 [Dendrobium catenatum]
MEVSVLPIASAHKEKLISAGYTTLLSIVGVSASRLAQELIIPHREAVEIIKVTLKCCRAVGLEGTHAVLKGSRTAWEMLSDEQNLKLIRTGSEDFDGILGGGIHCGQVTEMGGVPGIGKTQLGIQLAVNVQIPVSYGGLGAKAIYIDTEGSFMPERAYQIAEACIMDTWENLGFSRKEIEDCQEKMQPDHFLANILYFRICSYTEQIAVINYLDKFLEEHKDVKIVIIDSISFHFRQDFKEMVQRTIVLNEMSRQLMKLAERFAVAVLLLNHVTAKHTEGSFQLTLALGDTWSHSCTNRVILYWDGNDRHARIEKSPYLPSASAPFSVTGKGIRNAITHCKRLRMM